ncbi:polyribonucleotide nucleotidyltransferase [Actinomyces sp. zg-332]|uniref:polyribonucleotide nucleotidyltransferase n=1 Tax=Actinomyces sp. zg-332 TaxID=2708340 RepID=UPI001420D1B3|nr:polyribonucleotide nucleotidyltransferase [Actinomyces sp. zg-332]QPK93927.1 polyribonucleotide nucleotidyltransferase [Actinomyces sp. zg-332]
MEDTQFSEAIIDNGKYGKRVIRFETGRLARQAAGSAVAYLDEETVVLSATTVSSTPRDQFDFFPLTVDVEERQYAAGKIPGSFFRREGRPGTEAILASRLIDRPLRPSFVKGLRNEVQVVETVLAIHPDEAYDVLAINAASMSTLLAGLPFSGPIGGTRLSLIDDQWVAFPRHSEIEKAIFSMVVAGRIIQSKDGEEDVAIMMVEAEATENTWDKVQAGFTAPTEEVVAEALELAKPFIRELCLAQIELAKECAKPQGQFELFFDYTDEQYADVERLATDKINAATTIVEKLERETALEQIADETVEALAEKYPEEEYPDFDKEIRAAVRSLTKHIIRTRVLTEGKRIDGRGLRDIRTLSAEVDVLPRVHGSAIFERGETQILGVSTLNMLRMEQQIDSLTPVTRKRYMHQYNFPPFSTGEVGRVGSPKRREIGHGALAERALIPVIPPREEFPYAIRQVSEALGSNGSTSMGSVCASTLSLLNAGVPLRAPVAGIAMGLMSDKINDETRYATLTDILGAEDAFGDMDFKVAGTREFVTAIQLDTKLDGIPASVLAAALKQAKEARLYILDVMSGAIDEPDEMSDTAPRVISLTIPVDKIGEVIGPKGKTINQIQEDTGAEITVEDDGTVYIGASDGISAEKTRKLVDAIVNPKVPEKGERYVGTVVKTTTFGAFISLVPGCDGLLHISQIRRLVGGRRVNEVEEVLTVGQEIEVEIAERDPRGKLNLYAVIDGVAQGEDNTSKNEEKSEDRNTDRERSRRQRTRTRKFNNRD